MVTQFLGRDRMTIEVALEATPSGPDSEFNLQGYACLYVRVAQDTSRGREHIENR